MKPSEDCSALGNIRLRLEEKRRQIEQEKRKVEAAMSKQLQKVGKAAFLQAINKRVGAQVLTPPLCSYVKKMLAKKFLIYGIFDFCAKNFFKLDFLAWWLPIFL